MPTWAKAAALFMGVTAVYFALSALFRLDQNDRACEVPVVVEVLNGCGVPGIADNVAENLRAEHFDVMFVGNADDFDYDETLVVDRSGDPSKARDVSEALGKPTVIHQVTTAFFVDVTVVVGRDLAPSTAGSE
jgi:hypothetical protein